MTADVVAAALFGEMHGMVTAAVARCGGETTPANVARLTNISPIDLHHSVADLVKADLCSICDGTIRLLTPSNNLVKFIQNHGFVV